jgi:hypothetical protein
MEPVSLRIVKSQGTILVAACDRTLLGKTFREGRLKLDVLPSFYQGVASTIEETMQALESASIGNLVGELVVTAAIEKGFVSPEAVIKIAGIPHAQIVKV